jgi:tRNA(Ile)-lysidine synthase
MIANLQNNLDQAGLRPDDPIVLGISGGPDSLALLHALTQLSYSPHLFHMNYGLHDQADAHEQFVTSLANDHHLELTVKRWAQSRGTSIERKAREARYTAMFALAAELSAVAVLVAHTADDQAETVLMNVIRGTGTEGLSGMAPVFRAHGWHGTIPLLRPLLETTRAEIETYLKDHALSPALDPTNQDTRITRNRIRLELLPALESFNPGIKSALVRMAQTLRHDHDLLQSLADEALSDVIKARRESMVELNLNGILELPMAIRNRVLRAALIELSPPGGEVGYAHIEQVNQILAQLGLSLTGQPIVNNISLLVEGDALYFYCEEDMLPLDHWPQWDRDQFELMPKDSPIALNAGWILELTHANHPPDPFPETAHTQVWLQTPAGAPLTLRSARSGDAFKPLGMTGTQKLSDLFTDQKVPQRARALWPLVCIGDTIAWVPGLKMGEPFKVTDKNKPVIHIHLRRREG